MARKKPTPPDPIFTAIAVAVLAVGIGANTTIFSLLNALFLKLSPGAEPIRCDRFERSTSL